MSCKHNHRCRYFEGYFCEDCETFFPKDSQVYRETELPSEIGFVLHNINATRVREGLPIDDEVKQLCDKFFPILSDEDLDTLIAEAEVLMAKYGKNSDSATLTL